jgi:protein tyrosine phosphatase
MKFDKEKNMAPHVSLVVSQAPELRPAGLFGDSESKEMGEEAPYMRGANWVHSPDVPETFLLSAYPLDGFEEYWNGVIHDGVRIGIQLASVLPGDYHLASPGDKKQYALGEIQLVSVRQLESCTKRVYEITHPRSSSWIMTHLEFKSWGDMKTPEPASFDAFMQVYERLVGFLTEEMKISHDLPDSRLVSQVHCMGGIGRTGTFVFTRALRCHKDGSHSPYDILGKLRDQRTGLVETTSQEAFAIEHGRSS